MVDQRALTKILEIAVLLQDRDLNTLAEHQAELNRTKSMHQKFVQATEEENKVLEESLQYRRELESPRLAWRERQLYALSHNTARSAAMVEAQRRIASQSFGRVRVLEQIQENALHAHKKTT